MTTYASENLVSSLARSAADKRQLERRLAQLALGVIASLRNRSLLPEEAAEELFNLANYQELRRRRLCKPLVTLFQWGMELPDVVAHAPHGLEQSLTQMSHHAAAALAPSVANHVAASRH